jgi:magnesium-transporting ATPase (P-type)
MVFRKFSAGLRSYQISEQAIIIGDSDLTKVLRHLCLCHSVIIDPKHGHYNSSSPDELAIIDGAKLLNSLFVSKDQ